MTLTTFTASSEKQRQFAIDLAAQVGQPLDLDAIDQIQTKDGASKIIDALLAKKKAMGPTATVAIRRNKFAGKCVECGGQVDAEAGLLTKNEAGKWIINHDGPCPVVVAPAAPVYRSDSELPDCPKGYYAIKAYDGTHDYAFYMVNRPETGKYAGRVFVKHIIGGHPGAPIYGFEPREKIMNQIIAEGVDQAAKRYGKEFSRCGCCNKTLTDAISRKTGIGPECRKMRNIPAEQIEEIKMFLDNEIFVQSLEA